MKNHVQKYKETFWWNTDRSWKAFRCLQDFLLFAKQVNQKKQFLDALEGTNLFKLFPLQWMSCCLHPAWNCVKDYQVLLSSLIVLQPVRGIKTDLKSSWIHKSGSVWTRMDPEVEGRSDASKFRLLAGNLMHQLPYLLWLMLLENKWGSELIDSLKTASTTAYYFLARSR